MLPRPFFTLRCSIHKTILLLIFSGVFANSASWAGAYIFAGESNGINIITHPSGYTGTGTTLYVGVCIDTGSLNATDLEIPVQNNITIWNDLQPVHGNMTPGALASGLIDAESVLLHELGHCIGLAHVNLASESGASGSDQNYTKSTDGANNVHDINAGTDGVIGSADDIRGDDVNLHWFNPDNDPFLIPIPTPVDTTLYSRDVADLPIGDDWVVNADRSVSTFLGYTASESAMQQGSFYQEIQRELVSDDVSSILMAESGLDETSGTGDEYQLVLTYEGIVTNSGSQPECDITISIDDTSFAYCSVGGSYIGADHLQITSGNIHLGTSYNWHFNTQLINPPETDPPSPDAMTWATVPTTVDAYSITMTATTATDETGPVEYQFTCQEGGTGCTTSAWQTDTTYLATGLSPSTSYTYVVRARDAVPNTGGFSAAKSASTDSASPADPADLAGVAISGTEINLTWTDNSTNETGFKLERQSDGQGDWDVVAASLTPGTQMYPDSGLSQGTLYHYRVSAFNAIGSSGFSTADASTHDLPLDYDPSGLNATMASSSAINVVWTDVATNARSFVVQRSSVDSPYSWTDVGNVDPGIEEFQDTGLNANTKYWYQVYASNSGNVSSPSNVDNATTYFECSADIQIPANNWVFFSLPCTPSAPLSTQASEVFSIGPAVGSDYGTRWVIAKYDSSLPVPDWDFLDATENLVVGKGYILYSLDAFMPATLAGAFNTGGAITLDKEPGYGKWNLVGNPHIGTINWTGIEVHDGTSSHTWAEMDQDPRNPNKGYWCDDEPADPDCIMWRQMYKRFGYNTYNPYDGTGDTPSEQGTLDTAEAMWVRSHNAVSITMYLAAGGSAALSDAAPSAEKAKSKPIKGGGKGRNNANEWRVRLVATSDSLVDIGNWLGQQEGVQDGLDARDLEEWTPFGNPYLSILFTNPLFDEVDWGYTRDFRELTRKQEGEWSFVVRASSDVGEVTLTWEGDAQLFDNALLIDEISGKTIAVTPGGSYTFDLNGSEHPFRIVFN